MTIGDSFQGPWWMTVKDSKSAWNCSAYVPRAGRNLLSAAWLMTSPDCQDWTVLLAKLHSTEGTGSVIMRTYYWLFDTNPFLTFLLPLSPFIFCPPSPPTSPLPVLSPLPHAPLLLSPFLWLPFLPPPPSYSHNTPHRNGMEMYSYLSNRVTLLERFCVKKYYDCWLICDDRACARRTRQQPSKGTALHYIVLYCIAL